MYLSIYLCLSIYAVKIYHKNYIPIKHIQPSYINFMWTLTIFCFFNNKKALYYIFIIFLSSLYLLYFCCFCCCCYFYNELFYIRIQKNRIRFYIFFFLSISSFFLFLHIMCVSQCFSIISHMNVFLCVLLFFFVLYNQHRKYRKFRKSISKFVIFLAVFFLN